MGLFLLRFGTGEGGEKRGRNRKQPVNENLKRKEMHLAVGSTAAKREMGDGQIQQKKSRKSKSCSCAFWGGETKGGWCCKRWKGTKIFNRTRKKTQPQDRGERKKKTHQSAMVQERSWVPCEVLKKERGPKSESAKSLLCDEGQRTKITNPKMAEGGRKIPFQSHSSDRKKIGVWRSYTNSCRE